MGGNCLKLKKGKKKKNHALRIDYEILSSTFRILWQNIAVYYGERCLNQQFAKYTTHLKAQFL